MPNASFAQLSKNAQPDLPERTTSADHPRDLRGLLSPAAQSSRNPEQTDRAADVLPQGGPHPLPQRTGRNAQLLLSGSRVNHHFFRVSRVFWHYRLLDLGGDKPLPFLKLPQEDNPFLGQRGIRFLLQYPDLLDTQLQALVQFSCEQEIHILVPLVTVAAEMATVRSRLEAAAAD